MIFDTHAHYDDEAFDGDREELLGSLQNQGIRAVTNVAASLKSCETTLALAENYDFIYGAIGVHPSETAELDENGMERLEHWCGCKKIRAVGEIGLDYYWEEPDHEIQKKWFVRQLDLARRSRLPVIIHSRDAARDTLNMGFYLGIGGVLTFKNGRKLVEVAEYAPLSSIVLETDCPYLAPAPYRGKRNSSLNLGIVAQRLAEIKGTDRESVERITWENAVKLYRLQNL